MNLTTTSNSKDPDFSLQQFDLDLSSLLAGVIALIVVAIVVVAVLIVIVWYLKFRQLNITRAAQRTKEPRNGEDVDSNGGVQEQKNSCSCTSIAIVVSDYERNLTSEERLTSYISHQSTRNNNITDLSNSLISTDSQLTIHQTVSLSGVANTISVCNNSETEINFIPPRPPIEVQEHIQQLSSQQFNPVYSSDEDDYLQKMTIVCEEENGHTETSNGLKYITSLNSNNEEDGSAELTLSSCLVESYNSICDDFINDTSTLNSRKKLSTPMKVKPENIQEIGQIGKGQFGQVVLARIVGLKMKSSMKRNGSYSDVMPVAVKRLKEGSDSEIEKSFEKEIKLMKHLIHENIVRLLGICTTGQTFIVMEYMEKGDLSQYLRSHSGITQQYSPQQSPSATNSIAVDILVHMSLQIASGMKYLASLRFIHRDLAARNCLVGPNNIVKIADFGLSRSLYTSQYYKVKGCAVLPLRWMATECFYGKFSEKTDIWAFGVTMWEIFTLARKQPYDTMSHQDIIQDAIQGPNRQLLSKPDHCPSVLYENILLCCWKFEPNLRLNFVQVYAALGEYYSR